jgi:hypothetical protein
MAEGLLCGQIARLMGFAIIVDQSSDAGSEDHDMEVDQKADRNIQQTNVEEQLSVVNRV